MPLGPSMNTKLFPLTNNLNCYPSRVNSCLLNSEGNTLYFVVFVSILSFCLIHRALGFWLPKSPQKYNVYKETNKRFENIYRKRP